MASNGREVLHKEIGLSAAVTGGSKSLPASSTSFAGILDVRNSAGSGYTVKIQHSPNGINWFDLGTFVKVAGDGAEILSLSEPIMTQVRTDISGVAGTCDIIVDIRYDKRG